MEDNLIYGGILIFTFLAIVFVVFSKRGKSYYKGDENIPFQDPNGDN